MKKFSAFYRYISIISLIFILVGCNPITTSSPSPTEVKQTDGAVATETEPPIRPTTAPTNGSEVTPTPETISSIQIDEDKLQGTAIRFAHPFAGPGSEVLAKIAQEFSLTNPYDIWVDVQAYGNEALLISGLESDLEKNEPPDLIAMHPYEQVSMTLDYEPVDLAPYYQDQNWGFSTDAQADIPAVFLDQFRMEDRQLALPIAPQATVIFYNRSWANDLGFTDPPMDDVAFRVQSRDATLANLADLNEENDGLGGWIISYEPQVLLSWFHAFGGELPVNATPTFDNDYGLVAFNFLKSVYDEGYIWISRQPEPYQYFADRNALMYSGRLDQILEQKGWMALENNTDQWSVIAFPGSENTTMLVDSPGLMISSGTPEDQMAAWLFAKYFLEPKVQAEIVQALFTLPVRESTISLLPDFIDQYPQWVEAVDLIPVATPVPVAEGWGIAQWILQDAAYRVFPFEDVDLPAILKQLDSTVEELEGIAP